MKLVVAGLSRPPGACGELNSHWDSMAAHPVTIVLIVAAGALHASC